MDKKVSHNKSYLCLCQAVVAILALAEVGLGHQLVPLLHVQVLVPHLREHSVTKVPNRKAPRLGIRIDIRILLSDTDKFVSTSNSIQIVRRQCCLKRWDHLDGRSEKGVIGGLVFIYARSKMR